jgi:hypothetical protein
MDVTQCLAYLGGDPLLLRVAGRGASGEAEPVQPAWQGLGREVLAVDLVGAPAAIQVVLGGAVVGEAEAPG